MALKLQFSVSLKNKTNRNVSLVISLRRGGDKYSLCSSSGFTITCQAHPECFGGFFFLSSRYPPITVFQSRSKRSRSLLPSTLFWLPSSVQALCIITLTHFLFVFFLFLFWRLLFILLIFQLSVIFFFFFLSSAAKVIENAFGVFSPLNTYVSLTSNVWGSPNENDILNKLI